MTIQLGNGPGVDNAGGRMGGERLDLGMNALVGRS